MLHEVSLMQHFRRIALAGLLLAVNSMTPSALAADLATIDLKTMKTAADVVKVLNADEKTVQGRDDVKSYKVLFDAYLKMAPPPIDVGADFNLATIHPKMRDWDKVRDWAEGNAGEMSKAILEAKQRKMVGLPYGANNVSSEYREAGVMVTVAEGGTLRDIEFSYQKPLEIICAYSAAEMYRLLEAGKTQEGLDLGVATFWVLRQFCDRNFLNEKLHSMYLLNAALSNMRDVFYLYQDKIEPAQFTEIAFEEIPFLRPDYNQLLMPEADKLVAAAIIHEVFDSRGQPVPENFAQTFASIQAADSPLTQFGAARRWAMIATVHASLDASLERVKLVYDDWWRRWRLPPFDTLMAMETEFDNTNPVRYAAVAYSLQDIAFLFDVRNELIANVNGTAIAAGISGYKRHYGTYPDDVEKAYSQFFRKISDLDPWSKDNGTYEYRPISTRHALDTDWGRIWIEPGESIAYAVGQDNEDSRGAKHTDDGMSGDVVVWPPIKAKARQAGLMP